MSFSKVGLTTSFVFSVALSQPYRNGTQTDCTETISVTDVDFRQSVDCDYFGFPCDILEGTYYFNGFDSQGTPKYTQPETGAFFSVQIDQFNNYLGILASLGFTYNGSYFAPGWDHFADVRFFDQCTDIDIFEVESGALEGATNIQYFPKVNAPYPPLYIVAYLNDCKGVGFDNAEPTQYPTHQPTQPTRAPSPPTYRPTRVPVAGSNCPNYDYTEYSSCAGDANCLSCQPWGCAQCNSGYYKMGNAMRCQSCIDNYPGCSQCGDWNGCTTCSAGYLLDYSSACADEICV